MGDEGVVQLSNYCNVIYSGSVSDKKHGGIPGYTAENAFSNNRAWWGGRKSDGQFFLGVKCTNLQSVRSVQILQKGHDLESIELSCATQENQITTSSKLKAMPQ